MRDLVAEMAEQGAIGFAHRLALPLALGVVGLRHVERDEAAVMPGHDRRRPARRPGSTGNQRRDRSDSSVLVVSGSRKPQQRVEQPMLGGFDLAPMQRDFPAREIGDGAVVAAGRAKSLGLLGRHQPVADVVLGVGAKPERSPVHGKRAPAAVDRLQRA